MSSESMRLWASCKRAFAVAIAVALAAPALAQINWDMPTAYPADNFHTENIRQFADDIEEGVRRHGGRPASGNRRRYALDDRQVHVGGRQGERIVRGLDQDVGEDRDGIAPLDDALHMREGLQEGAALDGKFHGVLELSLGSRMRPAGPPARPNRAGETGRARFAHVL